MTAQQTAADRASATFLAMFNDSAPVLVQAPGRVNVIGEHTDYNDGFVLPIALPFTTAIAARARSDRRVIVESEGFGRSEFDLDAEPRSTTGWARYLHGVAWALTGHLNAVEGARPGTGTATDLPGWDGAIATDIPAGASLSSSAAIEVAVTLLFHHLAGSTAELSVPDLARIGQRVENEVMGLPSGLLDQLASAGGKAGHATLIDCRDLSTRAVPFPPSAMIVVLDTGTRRELVESEYADRQATCAAAARALGLASLRDATIDDLDRLATAAAETPDLDPDVAVRRVRHVVTENARTLAAVDAMEAGELGELGRLMTESHVSLRNDYEVSGPALDAVVEAALECIGCYGARMTGGGFAGGAIALVATDEVEAFCANLTERYVAPLDQPAVAPLQLYPTPPSAGARIVRPVDV